ALALAERRHIRPAHGTVGQRRQHAALHGAHRVRVIVAGRQRDDRLAVLERGEADAEERGHGRRGQLSPYDSLHRITQSHRSLLSAYVVGASAVAAGPGRPGRSVRATAVAATTSSAAMSQKTASYDPSASRSSDAPTGAKARAPLAPSAMAPAMEP